MAESDAGEATLILARTRAGAESAARLVRGDAVSVVDQDLTEDIRARAGLRQWEEVIVEADPDADWLGPTLALAKSLIAAGGSIRLVLNGAGEDSADPLAQGLSGWAVNGVAVEGDVVSLRAAAGSEDLDVGTTADTVRGALKLVELLRTVSDPAGADLEEFEYRSALVMSYLTEIPRLHSRIEDLQAELKAALTTERELRHQFEMAALPSIIDEGSPSPTSPPREPRDHPRLGRRNRKLLILGTAASAWVGLAIAAAVALDAGTGGFLTLLALGAILAAILDNRRRAITLLGAARQSASTVKAVRRLERVLEQQGRQTTGTVRAVSGEIARHAAATQQYVSQVGAQLAGAVSSDTRTVISELQRATADANRATAAAAEQAAARKAEIVTAITRGPDLRAMVRAELLIAYKQLEGNLQLRDLVDVTGPTPQLRGWAASPDVLVFLVQELRRLRPRLVVECGSGASTVWLAMACRTAKLDTRIVALEHELAFAAETSRLLDECGVVDLAEVRHAPLEEVNVNNRTERWYRLDALDGLTDVGLLFVDGPPGTTSAEARYPALPLMRPRLAHRATIVLDDIIRQEERSIADSWESEFPELERWDYSFEKGAAVFRLGSGNQA